MNKDMIKKITPIVAGIVIAGIGVLVGLGVLQADVEKVQPVKAGDEVTFVAGDKAVMVKASVDVALEGTNYASGPCWILYGMEPATTPETPAETPIVPATE